jgi:hypothetical protein
VALTVTAATFSDPGSPDPAGSFTASIDWGDGTTTAGSVAGSAGGVFTVTGTHTYADEGPFTELTSVSEPSVNFTTGGSAGGQVTVAEADSLSGSGVTISSTEGQSFSGSVATFTDTNPAAVAADFTASIDWGDGTTTTGSVAGGNGTFTVSGSHTYADEGSYTTSVTLTDDAPGTATASASATANVAEADALTPLGVTFGTTEGRAFSGSVATFTDTGYPNNTAADFTATIDWGDGTTTPGSVSGSGGAFTVSGSHTYRDEGNFTVTTTLADDAPGTATASASGTAVVAEADTPEAFGVDAAATEGVAFDGVVASVSDLGFTDNAGSDFAVTIAWGDGTTSAGSAEALGFGRFNINGSHVYAEEGTFTTHVTVTDDAPGTATAAATGTVSVEEGDAFTALSGPSLSGAEQSAVGGVVAVFADTGFPTRAATGLTAAVSWGDGTISPGTVVAVGGGVFEVMASHTYADEGTNAIVVTLSDDAPGTATATATGSATIGEADALLASGVTITVPVRSTFNGMVAAFTSSNATDVAGDFTATINWGDGTTTTGAVVGQGGTFAVTGSHAYQSPGTFPITVQIADDAPGTATATATGTANVTFTPSQRFLQQVLVATLLQPSLETSAAAVQDNFAMLFGASVLGSGLGQANDLVMNEMKFMFDFVLGLEELALGIKNPALQAQITQLEFQIENSPLWQTALGFDLGATAKALALEAAFPD